MCVHWVSLAEVVAFFYLTHQQHPRPHHQDNGKKYRQQKAPKGINEGAKEGKHGYLPPSSVGSGISPVGGSGRAGRALPRASFS